ncbi:MAG TPA: UPF0182 family protein [Vicinamibacterales bacterium]|nr:UPF0182 family protein [Vicinamibacterales bacterium]
MKLRAVLAILALVAFVVLPNLVDFLMEWFWFGAIGYRSVFVTSLRAQASLFAFVLLFAFLVLYGNLWIAISSIASPYIVIGGRGNGTVQPAMVRREQLRKLVGVGCLVISLLISLAASGEWMRWLQFRHGVPFGIADPILGYDIGFYVFQLPLFDLAQQVAIALVIVAIIGSGAAYVLAGALNFTKRDGVSVAGKARLHLSLLAAVFFAVLTVNAYLQVPHLLTDVGTTSIVHGASYADVMARIPAARALMAIAALGVVLAAFHAFSTAIWPLPLALGLYFLTSISGSLYAAGIQRFIVSPNEQAAEMPYMVHNIEATRQAFNLASVRIRQVSGDAELTRADIERNADTIKNVRLWDHQPLLDTFGQIQELRTYYDFVSVDNDRYTVNGELRQVMLSARELNPESLPNRTWINEHLTFTHGYGITLGPVNEVTEEGLPILFVKDIPPQSTVPADIDVKEPSIYFGEVTNNYVLVNTKAKEFHYSKGEQNVETTYSGSDGVRIGGLGRKLIFSLGFQSLQILFSNDITPDTRVLYHRNITDRVVTIAPFLRYDEDPYLVVSSEGRLFWIRDAYTSTSRYPYSTPAIAGLNYIRNSVKVVTDAYNGTTEFFVADPRDPLVQTLARAFPGLLKPLEAMPADLRRHLRYPETIFAVQAAMYATYHMTNPGVFYNKEDQWEIPAIDIEGNPQVMQPYYTVMRLPGEPRAEFIQMLPFTPARKDNLAAWLIARSDPERYGELEVFEFPKQKIIYGPRQIIARINQDQAISPQITLWNQQGSQVIQGTLLVIPVEEALLYVRPLYLKASGGKIPELNRVIVAYRDQIVMAETLDAALDQIFGNGGRGTVKPTPTPARSPSTSTSTAQPAPPAPVDANLAIRARQHYERAMQAQRDGNWAVYGEEIRLLGETLRGMSK